MNEEKLVRLDFEFTHGEPTPPTATVTGYRMNTKAGPVTLVSPAHCKAPRVMIRPSSNGWSVSLKGYNPYNQTTDCIVLYHGKDQDDAREFAKRFMGLARIWVLESPTP